DLESRLDNMEFTQLDPVTDDALRRLAGRHSDLVRYDPDRGMLQFASDLTFDSGSDAVKQQAMSSLSALAGILKSPEASGYDTRIVGHTDSQPLSANTRKRYPSNMHLSTYRAISVRNELIKLGVPAARMLAAGWGEYRPAVQNTQSGNTPANRRVEIYLVPGQQHSTVGFGPAGSGAVIDRESLGGSAYEPSK
ncbi:MAG: OmpA family protein, partial [Phycisphaerales bacterium]|nr:OmpA family protein [Phycisphaerales bacterium]